MKIGQLKGAGEAGLLNRSFAPVLADNGLMAAPASPPLGGGPAAVAA